MLAQTAETDQAVVDDVEPESRLLLETPEPAASAEECTGKGGTVAANESDRFDLSRDPSISGSP